jgi:uncharacterized membrane protein (UPF0127 family)
VTDEPAAEHDRERPREHGRERPREHGRSWAGWVGVAAFVAVVVALVLGLAWIASHGPDDPSFAATALEGPPPSELPEDPAIETAPGRDPLPGFGELAAAITDAVGEVRQSCLMAATTPVQRARGLMEVTDPELGGYDGMAFVFEAETTGGFWMRNTPMPLSIAFFAGDGSHVASLDMAPCTEGAACPLHRPGAPYRYAVEVPQGELAALGIGPGSSLSLGEGCPPP